MIVKFLKAKVLCAVLAVLLTFLLWLLNFYGVHVGGSVPVGSVNSTVPWWLPQ
jgi:hypothetical protein